MHESLLEIFQNYIKLAKNSCKKALSRKIFRALSVTLYILAQRILLQKTTKKPG